jgi:hypothetical protein
VFAKLNPRVVDSMVIRCDKNPITTSCVRFAIAGSESVRFSFLFESSKCQVVSVDQNASILQNYNSGFHCLERRTCHCLLEV